MTSRLIDTVTHELTAPQVLELMLRLFSESRNEPIVLMTKKGIGQDFVKRIRAELSRNRSDISAGMQFGFKCGALQEYRLDGINQEGIPLTFHMTPLQVMKNLAGKKTEIQVW